MSQSRFQFGSLYLLKFGTSFGGIAVTTLLSNYITLLGAEGIVVGLFTTALTFTQAVTVVPIGWAGDRFDKRTVLLGAILVTAGAYVAFPFVETSFGFIVVRALQGLGLVGTGMLSLALVGQLAPGGERANFIGTYNAARMAAGILGALGAGSLYQLYGFSAVFAVVTALVLVGGIGVFLFVEPDETRIEGFAFGDLALNERILTITSFRTQYAVAVTLIRTWIPIYAGLSYARGGLALASFLVGVVVAAEKFANMLGQPITGRFSDRYGRVPFVAIGGGFYGLVGLAIPFAPAIGRLLPSRLPIVGAVSGSLIALVCLNALLGAADSLREPASMALFADEGSGEGIASSFGVRDLVWRPGAILAPLLGGVLMSIDMSLVFFVGGAFALSGVAVFLGVLTRTHGRGAVTAW